ncbi:hypothetical protein Tco_0902003 [Tanacetum coccineum]
MQRDDGKRGGDGCRGQALEQRAGLVTEMSDWTIMGYYRGGLLDVSGRQSGPNLVVLGGLDWKGTERRSKSDDQPRDKE